MAAISYEGQSIRQAHVRPVPRNQAARPRPGHLYEPPAQAKAGLVDRNPLAHISGPPARCKASPRYVLGRARSLRLRTLPASLRGSLFAADGRDLLAR